MIKTAMTYARGVAGVPTLGAAEVRTAAWAPRAFVPGVVVPGAVAPAAVTAGRVAVVAAHAVPATNVVRKRAAVAAAAAWGPPV
jgi:hypothetical protein